MLLLAGMEVVEVAQDLSGRHAAEMLATLGADLMTAEHGGAAPPNDHRGSCYGGIAWWWTAAGSGHPAQRRTAPRRCWAGRTRSGTR
ncbi:MAG TPA: hypothetical protein VGC15_22715 [Acetobacteraceae bacterium]